MTFFGIILVCLVFGQTFAIESSQLDTFNEEVEVLKRTIANYDALIESSKRELFNIERDFNARLLTRTGFVFQEMKDLENEISNELIIETENAECIELLRDRLTTEIEAAGNSSMESYRQILSSVSNMPVMFMYPILSSLSRANSEYALDPLDILTFFNPMTDFDNALSIFITEAENYESLFEPFIDQIRNDAMLMVQYHWELDRTLTSSLDGTRNRFRDSVREIRELLRLGCN